MGDLSLPLISKAPGRWARPTPGDEPPMSTSLRAPARCAPSADAAPPRPRGSAAWLVVLVLAVALVPFVQELTHQPAVRYAQSAALVEDGSVRLDRFEGVVGVDRKSVV